MSHARVERASYSPTAALGYRAEGGWALAPRLGLVGCDSRSYGVCMALGAVMAALGCHNEGKWTLASRLRLAHPT